MSALLGHRFRKATCPTCQRKVATNVKGKHHKAAHGTPWPMNGKGRSKAADVLENVLGVSNIKPHMRVLQDASCAAIRGMDFKVARDLIDVMELTITEQP